MEKMIKKINIKMTIAVLITAVLCGIYVTLPSVGAVSLVNVAVRVVLFTIGFIVVSLVLYNISHFIIKKIHCKKIEAMLYDSLSDSRFVLILWGILIICWLPAYLAFYPGIFGYDAPNQMQQILGIIPLSAHHPVLHTAILGVFMNVGKLLFDDYNSGVALFCALQGIFVTGSIAYFFLSMKTKRTPFPILFIAFVGCAFNPVLQVLSFNTTKDILFGVCFIHFVTRCYKWLNNQVTNTKKDIISLVFWGIITCLLRNQGKYVILVLLLACVFMCKKEWKLIISLGIVVLISQLFFSFSTNAFGVVKGDEREMLSVPMQQMSLVCIQYAETGDVNLTQEEFDKFILLVDEEFLPDYTQDSADPIKSNFITEVLKQDLWGYVKLYISVGIKNPGYYLMAVRNMIYPYWDMSVSRYRFISVENTFPHLSLQWGIEQTSLLPQYKEFLTEYIIYTMGEKNAVLPRVLQPGLCIWLMTALFGVSLAKSKKDNLVVTLTLFLFFGTLLLGPVALLRYIYPLMLAIPLLISLLCNVLEDKKSMFTP